MKNVDLVKINSEIETFITERDWDQFHSVKNLAMALSVESAELLEIFQWMTENQSNGVKTDFKTYAKLQDEVADVFVYLMRIVSKTEIDLETVVLNKIKKNAEKYPVDKSKGNSKKYSDL